MSEAARLIDGKAMARQVTDAVAQMSARFRADRGRPPGLAVVLVGEDPASKVYVRSKGRMAAKCGPRARKATSCPAAASSAPKYPPMAPAPMIAIRICNNPSTSPACDNLDHTDI